MSPADSFWTFSLALYGKPGAEAACLELQDRFGADVNLALYCLWIGRDLTPAALDLALETAAPLQAFIAPLRNMRRDMPKGGDDGAREAIKRAELQAEKLEQEALEALGAPDTPNAAAAIANLRLYASRLEAHDVAFLAAAAPLISPLS